jgi:transcriptional regulator with XRE-family HTH domain
MTFLTPAEVSERIRKLGARIRIARKRRGWTVAETAEKAGINRNTLTALEMGKGGVSISAYVSVLWVLGLASGMNSVADPDDDVHGKTLEASRRPLRARKRKPAPAEYDF